VNLDCTDSSIIAELLAAVDDHLKANTGRLGRLCELLRAPFEAVCSTVLACTYVDWIANGLWLSPHVHTILAQCPIETLSRCAAWQVMVSAMKQCAPIYQGSLGTRAKWVQKRRIMMLHLCMFLERPVIVPGNPFNSTFPAKGCTTVKYLFVTTPPQLCAVALSGLCVSSLWPLR
jgi:hypothetical protein